MECRWCGQPATLKSRTGSPTQTTLWCQACQVKLHGKIAPLAASSSPDDKAKAEGLKRISFSPILPEEREELERREEKRREEDQESLLEDLKEIVEACDGRTRCAQCAVKDQTSQGELSFWTVPEDDGLPLALCPEHLTSAEGLGPLPSKDGRLSMREPTVKTLTLRLISEMDSTRKAQVPGLLAPLPEEDRKTLLDEADIQDVMDQ
jgi:ferredoxin